MVHYLYFYTEIQRNPGYFRNLGPVFLKDYPSPICFKFLQFIIAIHQEPISAFSVIAPVPWNGIPPYGFHSNDALLLFKDMALLPGLGVDCPQRPVCVLVFKGIIVVQVLYCLLFLNCKLPTVIWPLNQIKININKYQFFSVYCEDLFY